MGTVIGDSIVLVSSPGRPCITKRATITREVTIKAYWKVCK